MCAHTFGSRFLDLKALFKEFSDSGIFSIYGRNKSSASASNLKVGFDIAFQGMYRFSLLVCAEFEK